MKRSHGAGYGTAAEEDEISGLGCGLEKQVWKEQIVAGANENPTRKTFPGGISCRYSSLCRMKPEPSVPLASRRLSGSIALNT